MLIIIKVKYKYLRTQNFQQGKLIVLDQEKNYNELKLETESGYVNPFVDPREAKEGDT